MITSFYIAFSLLFLSFLSIRVIKARRKYKVAIGDGNNYSLKQLIRSQANFTEYAPIFLFAIFVFETIYKPYPLLIHALCMLFLIGRFLHVYGVTVIEKYENEKLKSSALLRVVGMAITFSCFITLSIALIIAFALQNFSS